MLSARFQAAPKESHSVVVKRIFIYLAHTQTLAYGTPKEQAFISCDIQTRIGRETMWIGSPLLEGANFLVALLLVGLPKSKVVCLSRPLKQSMWLLSVVVLNSYG